MTRFRSFCLLLALMLFGLSVAFAQDDGQLTASDINRLNQTPSRPWVSVHDPSVLYSCLGSTYYIFGSHRAWARSTDNLVSWEQLDAANLFGTVSNGKVVVANFADAFSVNQTTRVKALVNGSVQEVDFGPFDAKAWAQADVAGYDISGNLWAPDVIWNPTMQKWCMYMSVNGDNWHSVIVLLTADKITGPYVYQGPVTYSGFINGTNAAISWKKTDLELVLGVQASLPARYNRGKDWGTYWPNNIDPCVFFDDDGRMWMTYGSWSGGIFLLQLDKETGLRDYTVAYPVQNDNNGRAVTDPYYGRRIAGGYYSSGEASYIQKIGQYYYLFLSYGGLTSTGGYEVAIFRSRQLEGPYLDAQNLDAFYNGRYWLNYGPKQQTIGGTRPFGAYADWGFMGEGELAQGHNSAIVDDKGRSFIVYHTRFNNGTEAHQVRVHQLFQNADGWLCAAPFQFDGEEDTDATLAAGCHYTADEIAGDYDVLIHRYRLDHENREVVTPIRVTLSADGRIAGDLSGQWSMTSGTAYITLTAGSVQYKGVVVQQQVDGTAYKAVAFTAMATTGVSIWGWKMEPQSAIAYTAKHYTLPVKANATVSRNLALYGTGSYGATIEWESSRPDIISHTGKYNPTDEAVRVQLTCRLRAGKYTYERTFQVTASKAVQPSGDAHTGIRAYYDFDEQPTRNRWNTDQHATYGQSQSGTAPTLETDVARFGQVAHLYFGDHQNASFARFDNPLCGLADLQGFTVSAWVRRTDDNRWDGLWSFADADGQLTPVGQRLYLNGDAYIGFNDGTQWFDVNYPTIDAPAYIPVGEWALVTLTASAADGVTLYVDGTKKSHKAFASSAGEAATVSAAAKLFDYQRLVDFVAAAPYMQLGSGSFWGSADARFDDLIVYDRALAPTDVRALNTLLNRVTDFTPVAIHDIAAPPLSPSAATLFDLSGRAVCPYATTHKLLKPGLYILGGRKVRVR